MTTTTNGPDEFHGPPCCRGIPKACPEYDGEYEYASLCQEHCCCCDPCKTVSTSAAIDIGVTGVCHGHCCKCIPKAFVVAFSPNDAETADCGANAFLIRPVSHTALYSVYSGNAPGIGPINIYIERDIAADVINRNNQPHFPCQWRLNIPSLYVDQVWRLNGRNISCLHPPTFDSITDVYIGDHCNVPCIGTITIEPYEETKVPFFKVLETEYISETVDVDCGICQEVCRVICVQRNIPGQELNPIPAARFRQDMFQWDDESGSWKGGKDAGQGCGGEALTVTSLDGDCYIQVVNLEINDHSFNGDLIALNPYSCSLGMDVYAEDEDGNWIRISCNQCHCWSYLCGRCRCVCPVMCMFGMDGTEFVQSHLYWSDEIWGWTDGETTISIGSVPGADCGATTQCRLSVSSGWVGGGITGSTCGSGLAVEFTNDTAEIAAGSLKWRIAFCSPGSCRLMGCCEELSDTIYADFDPAPFVNHPSADYQDIYFSCADPFTMELHLVPGESSADGQPGFRWIGKQLYVCRNCTGPDGGETLLIMEVEITCQDNASLFRYRSYLPGTDTQFMPWFEEIVITPPCKVCGIMPDIQFDIQGEPCRALSGTLQSFMFHVTISE